MTALLNLFRKPSPMAMAMQELVDAEHALLVAHTGLEWAQASVTYNECRIARLKAYLGDHGVAL